MESYALTYRHQPSEAAAETYTTGPHVASVGQGLFLVQLEHDQQFGVVGVGLAAFIGKTPDRLHG